MRKLILWDFKGSQPFKPSAERTHDLSCISAHFVNLACIACGKLPLQLRKLFLRSKNNYDKNIVLY